MLVKAVFGYVQDIRLAYVFNGYSCVHQLLVYCTSFVQLRSIDYLIRQIIWWNCRYFSNIIIDILFVRLDSQRSIENTSKHQVIESCINYEMCTDSHCSGNGLPTQHRHHCVGGIHQLQFMLPRWSHHVSDSTKEAHLCMKPPKRRTFSLRSLTKGSERMITRAFHQRG